MKAAGDLSEKAFGRFICVYLQSPLYLIPDPLSFLPSRRLKCLSLLLYH